MHKIITGVWKGASADKKRLFLPFFSDDEDGAKFHKLYFQWFNIIHEFGHILRNHHGINLDLSNNGADEEQAVNNFAVAYWREFGEPDKLGEIEKGVNEICKRYASENPHEDDFLDYYNRKIPNMVSVEEYGIFQFASVKRAFDSDISFYAVLRDFGFKALKKAGSEIFSYPDDCQPQKIINDCRCMLDEAGVSTPETKVVLVDDPAVQCAE